MQAHVVSAGGYVPKDEVSADELSNRWLPEDSVALAAMKENLKPALAARPQNAITSDRRLLRFLRRYGLDVGLATQSYRDHLVWRKERGVDEMHDNIVKNNWGPADIPHGKKVLDLMPQIPCSFEFVDLDGNPVSIEYYGFNPENVLQFSPEEYLQYFIHVSEYKMLVLDYFSTVAEHKMITEARSQGLPLAPGWGSRAMRRLTVVRCLKGFQLSSSLTPRINFIKDLLRISQANYPYITDNSFFVNTPWMFTIVWSVLKTALSSHTQTKIHILNSNFYGTLSRYISPENLPPDLRRPGHIAKPAQASKSNTTSPLPLPIPTNKAPSIPAVPSAEELSSGSAAADEVVPNSRSIPAAASKKGRSLLLGSAKKHAQGKEGEHGCAILSLSEFEFSQSASTAPVPFRITIHSNPLTSTTTRKATSSTHAPSGDSQDILLPITSDTHFAVSLGPESIRSSILTLHFVVERTTPAGTVGGGGGGVCLRSTLEVLVNRRVAVDRLLCWVSFFDSHGRSVARLKASVSYRPPRTNTKQNNSKSGLKFSLFKSKSSTIKNQQGTDDDDDNSSAMRVEPKQISPRGPTALSLPPPLEDSESEQQPLDDDFAGGASTLQEEEEEDLQQPEQFHQQFELDSTPSDGEEPMLGSMGDGEWDGDGVFKPPEFSEEFISSIFGTFFLGVDGIGDGLGSDDTSSAEASSATNDFFQLPGRSDGGREVALDDSSSEWAVWCQEYFEVKKYAFDEGEVDARAAFEAWSYVRVLTRDNREVDHTGTIFAPTLGLIREAIDVNCHLKGTTSRERPASPQSGSGPDGVDFHVYTVTPHEGAEQQSSWTLADEPCDWAVWTDEMFEVRRYGFSSEGEARAALDDWYSVRLLTYRDEEVASRSRWHTEALLRIRETMKANLPKEATTKA